MYILLLVKKKSHFLPKKQETSANCGDLSELWRLQLIEETSADCGDLQLIGTSTDCGDFS